MVLTSCCKVVLIVKGTYIQQYTTYIIYTYIYNTYIQQVVKGTYKFRRDMVSHVKQLVEDTAAFFTKPTQERVQESNMKDLFARQPDPPHHRGPGE